MDFRRDIEGLRGLSVLLVLLFHLDINFFSGGFIGVDIFFVISGFLITNFICNDLNKNTFSFESFYFRRAKRLIPTLLIVLTLVYCCSFFIFQDLHFSKFSESMFYSLFSVSNIYFWKNIGYFAQDSIYNPIIHLWSLSVEAQFYLTWPLYLYLVYGSKKKNLAIIFTIIILITSFFLNKVYIENSTAFYNSPTRAFQFSTGALIYFTNFKSQKKPIIYNILFLLGISLIIFSTFKFDSKTQYPYINSLVPTLGAYLMISNGKKLFNNIRVLIENRTLLFFGKISYPLYLVHWPVIVFFSYTLDQLNLLHKLIIVFVSVIIAYLINDLISEDKRFFKISWFSKFSYKRFFPIFMILIFLSSLSWNGIIKKEYLKLDEKGVIDNLSAKEGNDTDYAFERFFSDQQFFKINTEYSSRNLVVGDSHAAHLIPSFKVIDDLQDTDIFFRGGCIPLIEGFFSVNTEICKDHTRSVYSYIEKNSSIKNIIISARWANYFTTELFHEFETFTNQNANDIQKTKRIFFSKTKNFENVDVKKSRKDFLDALIKTIDYLNDRKLNVLILGQVPPYGFPKSYIGTSKTKNVNNKKIERVEGFNLWASKICEEEKKCNFIDLSKYFKIDNQYVPVLRNYFAFHDYSHLNVKGALILGMLIEKELKKNLLD